MPTGAWLYSYFALWLLVLLECGCLAMLVRQVERLYGHWIRNDPDWGLPLGSLAPALPAADLYGRPLSLGAVRRKKTALFFLSPGCGGCKGAIQRVGAVVSDDGLEVVLVVRASELQAKLFLAEHRREARFPAALVVADPGNSIGEQYKVAAVPYIFVVDAHGRVAGKGSGFTLTEIGHLIAQADLPGPEDGRQPEPPMLAAGRRDPAP